MLVAPPRSARTAWGRERRRAYWRLLEMKILAPLAADAPATVLAEEIMPTDGRQVPLPFSVEVPRDALQGAVRTTARVRIEDGSGQLLWITDTNTPVTPTAGSDRVDLGSLMLVRTPG